MCLWIGVEELRLVQALCAKAEAKHAAVQQPEAELTSSKHQDEITVHKIIQKESSETSDNEELTGQNLAFERIEENLGPVTDSRHEIDLFPSQKDPGNLLDYQASIANCRVLVEKVVENVMLFLNYMEYIYIPAD